MDPAVGLVQSYLRLNGFLTATEYPVLSKGRHALVSITDIDVLAVRFPNAQHWISGRSAGAIQLENDPVLDIEPHCLQMIIGEVKEGPAKLNARAYAPAVIETAIRRFGCCEEDPREVALRVVQSGAAETHIGTLECRIRMMVFGGSGSRDSSDYDYVGLRHIAEYLNRFVERHRDVFTAAQPKDDVLDLMALLSKLGLRF
jgi:hypothetical protein